MSWMGYSAWVNEGASYTGTGFGFCCSFSSRNNVETVVAFVAFAAFVVFFPPNAMDSSRAILIVGVALWQSKLAKHKKYGGS